MATTQTPSTLQTVMLRTRKQATVDRLYLHHPTNRQTSMVAPSTVNSRSTTTTSSRSRSVVSRPALVLQISKSLIRATIVGQPLHTQHIVPTPTIDDSLTAQEYYRVYSPLFIQVLALVRQDLSERHVLVLTDDGIVIQNAKIDCWTRLLLNDYQVKGIKVVPTITVIAHVLPPLIPACLVVHVLANGTMECLAFGREPLEYTYQCVPASTIQRDTETKNPSPVINTVRDMMDHVQHALGDNETSSASLWIVAILQCIAACPRAVRAEALAHLVLAGEGAVMVPQLGLRIARKLQQVLQRPETKPTVSKEAPSTTTQVDNTPTPTPTDESSTNISYTYYALPLLELQPLALRVRVMEIPSVRSDLLALVGAHVWANHVQTSTTTNAQAILWKTRPESKETQ